MNVGAPEMLTLIVIGGMFVLPIWGIIDAAVRSDADWARASQNKVVWVLVQIFLSGLGALVYLSVIRPKLKAAAAASAGG